MTALSESALGNSFLSAGCATLEAAPRELAGHNGAVTSLDQSYRTARRVTLAGIGVSALLACSNIIIGMLTHSTSVVATGFEFAGDVLASSIVLIGMGVAARPADDNHPYGHGRFETLSAFVVGVILAAAGVTISYQSLHAVGARHAPPGMSAAAALVGSVHVVQVKRGSAWASRLRSWATHPGDCIVRLRECLRHILADAGRLLLASGAGLTDPGQAAIRFTVANEMVTVDHHWPRTVNGCSGSQTFPESEISPHRSRRPGIPGPCTARKCCSYRAFGYSSRSTIDGPVHVGQWAVSAR